jgi:hypothetical protein
MRTVDDKPQTGTVGFRTEDLPFAAFIYASRRLPFVGCESVNRNGRIAFVFEDTAGEGEQLHIQFESGAACPAVAYYDSVRHLRRVMSRVQSKGTHEHEYLSRTK